MSLLADQYYQHQLSRTLTGKYKPHGDPAKADCVIAAGFGYRHHEGRIAPSLSTRQIAAYVAQFEHLPKILTHDVASAYHKLIDEVDDSVHTIIHPEHLSAIRIVNMFRDIMKHERHQTALLLAHPHHLPWLDYLCSQIDIMTVVPAGLHVAFDPVSVQPWTRDLESWQAEVTSRLQSGYAEQYHPITYRLHHN